MSGGQREGEVGDGIDVNLNKLDLQNDAQKLQEQNIDNPIDEQNRLHQNDLDRSQDKSQQDDSKKYPKRIDLASLRTTTMFEQRDATNENHNKPFHEWTIPKTRGGRAPRAATLFLGKDHERWQQYERERMDGTGSAGLRLAWRAGTSSTIQVGSSTMMDFDSDGDDDEDDELYSTYTSDTETDGYLSVGEGNSFKDGISSMTSNKTTSGSNGHSRRNSLRRSSSRGSKSHGSKGFPRITQNHPVRRGSVAESIGASSTHSGNDGTSSTDMPPFRPRRFSSNGPEAAFLRHETVIGIHTPRRDSTSSNASSGSNSNRQILSNYERVSLAPLSQIKTPPSGKQSIISSSPKRRAEDDSATPASKDDLQSGSPLRRQSIRSASSSEMLKKAAEAAAAAVQSIRTRERSISHEYMKDWDELNAKGHSPVTFDSNKRNQSPNTVLKLAPRRKPIKVDGTLYDRSGPFREGAVTDGLCVRFFSSEDSSPSATYEHDSHRHNHGHKHKSGRKRSRENGKKEDESAKNGTSFSPSSSNEVAVADEEMVPTTYLITTPDNRVSSAAKLRRWAMDGEGKFYAAMEIKSIEAKMRAADPSIAGGTGGIPKSVLRGLRDRYVDDLLDEVQKAETLNPDRVAVSHVLLTSDHKYLRLEEDYPEEAFFVIAGCDEQELKPVISLVFAKALRAIAKFHSAGWLHGDIKLENLMFDDKGELVVIDYENANPFRGIPGGDGKVTLVSYDWIPPEAFLGPQGRRAGPSADLWALGCNIVRAFALRDNIEDVDIRECLLGKGQEAFLSFRRTSLLRRSSTQSEKLMNGNPIRRGSDIGIPGSSTRPLPTAADVDLSSLLSTEEEVHIDSNQAYPPPPGPSPQRLLNRFARESPELLKVIIARCISDLPEERSVEAEIECLRFTEGLEEEQKERGENSLLGIGHKAVMTAIELSGSAWVKPKLEEARKGLRLSDSTNVAGEVAAY